jgi:hypothetical protein
MSSSSEHDFDTWLDALIAARSTPAMPADADSADLRDAARQFHGLAGRAEQETGSVNTLSQDWSSFMQSYVAAPRESTSSPDGRGYAAFARRHTPIWQVTLNMALAALLVVVLGVGIWRITGSPGDPEDSGTHQTAFAPDTRTFEPIGTPVSQADLPAVPTAAECTVEPLTVDEVLRYVESPGAAMRGQTMVDGATPPAIDPEPTQAPDGEIRNGEIVVFGDATPADSPGSTPTGLVQPGPASDDQLAAIASLERMWMACVLADSPFQRWALESPTLVAEQVQMVLPTFASEDEARAILEEVERTGELIPSEDFWQQPNASYQMLTSAGYPSMNAVAVIEPANAESWTLDSRTFWVTYSVYDVDGTLMRDGRLSAMETPVANEPVVLTEANGERGCDRFGITWFPDRTELLISWYPHCG